MASEQAGWPWMEESGPGGRGPGGSAGPRRRVLSLWLPCLATDRIRRRRPPLPDQPLVTVLAEHGRLRVGAVDRVAEGCGLAPGLPLADARALEPGLAAVDGDPAGDGAAVLRLCDWTTRYTPWAAVDPAGQTRPGAAGLWLDITGCAHLWGGEDGLLADLLGRLDGTGLEGRAAVADTPGAAWAWARFGPAGSLPSGAGLAALTTLPVAALRLPDTVALALRRVGLRSVGEVAAIPRPALTARFGPLPALRLDQAAGHVEEPIAPRRPTSPHGVRLAFPEPLATPEDMERVLRRLLAGLCRGLETAGEGARRLVLSAWRVDGAVDDPPQRIAVGTARPARDPAHLFRLFQPKLAQGLEPGPGFEVMALDAPATDPFVPHQVALPRATPASVQAAPSPGRRTVPPAQDRMAAAETGAARGHLTLVPGRVGAGGTGPSGTDLSGGTAGGDPWSGPLPYLVWTRPDPPAPPAEEPWQWRKPPPKPRAVAAVVDPWAGLPAEVTDLVDRLGARLGLDRVMRPVPRQSWRPERAVAWVAADGTPPGGPTAAAWPADRPRPVRLLPRPDPVDAIAPLPDSPPLAFTWRGRAHRVRRADGPERLSLEWWRLPHADPPDEAGTVRDYYRVEDQEGGRYWLCRQGLYGEAQPPAWTLQGYMG